MLTATTQRNIVIVVNSISPVTAYVSCPSETDLSCSTTRAARLKIWSMAAMSFFPVWPHTGRQYTTLRTMKACKICWPVRMFRQHPKRLITPTILLTDAHTFDACVDHFRSDDRVTQRMRISCTVLSTAFPCRKLACATVVFLMCGETSMTAHFQILMTSPLISAQVLTWLEQLRH